MKFHGKNIQFGENVKIGKKTRIGDNSIIYDNVDIGDHSIICNDCVIGEPLSDYYDDDKYKNPKTIIGKNALIRSHSLIYAGVAVGDNFSSGHRVTIREDSVFGNNCRIGTLSDIQGKVSFGDYCWLHSNVHIGQKSKVGNFVFIYPYVVFTNDPHPPSNVCIGPTIGDFSQIAVGAIIFPGIQVGENALVGANAVVTSDVEDFAVVVGNPAKFKCDIREIPSREKKNTMHYPWMYNFKRGMPWETVGYKNWIKHRSK
jgi:acetyltransferase-like isoleucine patch superfamily enzyme